MAEKENQPSRDIVDAFAKYLYENGEQYSNVSFEFYLNSVMAKDSTEDEKVIINAHSIILSLKCPKLLDFKATSTSAADIVAFKEFIKYIYTGDCEITSDNVNRLTTMAIIYDIPELRHQILKLVRTPEIILQELSRSLQSGDDTVKELSLSRAGELFSQILKSDQWKKMSLDTILEILKIDTVDKYFTDEMEVYKAVVEYCMYNNFDIGKLKHMIRFSTMNSGQLYKIVKQNRNLFTYMEISTIVKQMMNLNIDGEEFQYSVVPRMPEIIMSSDCRNVIEGMTIIEIDTHYEKVYDFISKVVTPFTVNKKFKITDIVIHNSVDVELLADVSIQNEYGTVYSRGRDQLLETLMPSGNTIGMMPYIELLPGKMYFIVIDFKFLGKVFHYRNVLKWDSQKTLYSGDVVLNFEMINPMLCALRIDNSDLTV